MWKCERALEGRVQPAPAATAASPAASSVDAADLARDVLRMCDVTHSYGCVLCMCAMTHSYGCVLCMCAMTHEYVCPDWWCPPGAVPVGDADVVRGVGMYDMTH